MSVYTPPPLNFANPHGTVTRKCLDAGSLPLEKVNCAL